MGIVQDLTPTKYDPFRFVVEIKPDAILTIDSLSLHTDIKILNADNQQLGNDHPNPQITTQQKTAFLNWILNNLTIYETNTGLTRHTQQ